MADRRADVKICSAVFLNNNPKNGNNTFKTYVENVMIPFFIILGIIIFNIIIAIVLFFSILEIDIKNLLYNSKTRTNHFIIYIRLKFLNKLTWVKIKIDDNKVEKYKSINNKILQKININLKNEIVDLRTITKIPFVLNKIDLKVNLSICDPFFTSLAIGIISTIISMLIATKIKNYSIENCKYKISPIFTSKLQLKIDLNCIISIKLVHIINIVYILFKKGSGNFGKCSSNRRTYASSNE